MRLGLISDIHINHWKVSDEYVIELLIKQCKENNIEYLFDAGDSCYQDMGYVYDRFIENDIGYYYVNGNHDYYGKTVLDVTTSTDEYEIDDKVYIGTTMWSDITNKEHFAHMLNDFRLIEGMTPRNYQKLFNRSYEKFQGTYSYYNEYLETEKDYIIMTHHQPSMKSVSEKYKNEPSNNYFCNNFDDYILKNPKIKLWMAGHVHSACDYMIGNCRVVANPCGYPNENHYSLEDYKIKIIEV